MIKAKNITHYYSAEKILSDVSLEIEEGSFTILTGESGSGKTTLLSILSTLLKPSSGEVFFDETPISKISNIDKFRNQEIGFVFQFHYLISHLSVFENIKMVTKKSKDDILNILDRVGIKELAYKNPNELSGGQKQRVAIARALINEPKYIFADEPTGNLDSMNSTNIFELLRDLDSTVLVVTHDKSLIESTDKVLIMKDGQLC